MTRRETQTSAGKRFAGLLTKRSIGSTAFAAMVGRETKAQHVNNWRRRGVPASHANLVASLLGCRPEEISSAVPASSQRAEIPPATSQRQAALSDGQQMLLAAAEGLDFEQLSDLIVYARDLRTGRSPRVEPVNVQPANSAPVPKTTEIFAYYGLDDDERQDELLRQLGVPEERLNSARAALGSWFANNANRRHEDRGPPDGVEARQANG